MTSWKVRQLSTEIVTEENSHFVCVLMCRYSDLTVDDIIEANIKTVQLPDNIDFESLREKFITYCPYFGNATAENMKQAYTNALIDGLKEMMRKFGREAYEEKVRAYLLLRPIQLFIFLCLI